MPSCFTWFVRIDRKESMKFYAHGKGKHNRVGITYTQYEWDNSVINVLTLRPQINQAKHIKCSL